MQKDRPDEGPRVRLGEILRRRRKDFVATWMELHRERLPRWADLSQEELSNNLDELLGDIADAAEQAGPEGRVTDVRRDNAATHADSRFQLGFQLEEITMEYGLLRRVLLEGIVGEGERLGPRELVLLNEALDMAVAAAVEVYTEAWRASLETKREFLEGVLRQMPLGVMVFDAESERLLVHNEQATTLLDLSPETRLSDLPAADVRLEREDGRPLAMDDWPPLRSLRGGESVVGEEVVANRGVGRRGWLRLSSSLVHDAQDRPSAVVCVVEDASERRAELECKAALERETERCSRLFQAVLQQIPAGIVVVDGSGELLLANAQVERLLRGRFRAVKELRTATRHADGGPYAPSQWPLTRSLERAVVVKGENAELERSDGTAVAVRLSAAPVTSGSAQLLAAVLMIEDVSERRRLEEERDRVWRLSGDLLCVAGFDVYLRRVNPAFVRTLGWTEEELLSSPLLAFVHPDDRARTLAEIRRLAQGVTTWQFENRYLCKDGSVRWLSWSATPLLEDRVLYAVGRDITDQKRADEAAHLLLYAGSALASTLDFASTINTVAQVAVPALADWCFVDLVGPDGKLERVDVAHANPRETALAGRLRQPAGLTGAHPISRALYQGRMVTLTNVEPETLPALSADPDLAETVRDLGARSWLSIPLSVRGQRSGVLTLIYAESGRRHSPEDFLLAEDLAQRCAQAVDSAQLFREAQEHVEFEKRLLGIVSHDLRDPLNALQLILAAALRGTLDEKLRGHLRRGRAAIDRASRLVEDLLDVTRVRAGQGIPLRPRPVDVAEFFRIILDDVQLTHGGRRVRLERQASPQAVWDPDRIMQVLTNLVGNALQYSPADSEVWVRLYEEGQEVVFDVHNEGEPIPPEQLDQIFELMQRGGRTRGGGLGLGLYIAQEVVTAHQGSIEVRSTEEEGTTFTVRLPRFLDRPVAVWASPAPIVPDQRREARDAS